MLGQLGLPNGVKSFVARSLMWTWDDQREGQFHIISIQRRLADHAFSKARTWPELQQAHQTWWTNYNTERVRHVDANRIPFTERRGWSTTSGSRD